MSAPETTTPSSWAVDLALASALVGVPLAVHTGVREFVVFKSLMLAVCVGAAALALALAPSSMSQMGSRRSGLLLLPVAHVLVVLAWRPSFAGADQAVALLSPMLLAWALALRVRTWSIRRLAFLVAAPLVIDLAWSLLQAAGIGVLPATAAAFGGTHGVAVGTIGNPNENAWYLILATTLLAGLGPASGRRWLAWMGPLSLAVLVVVCVDRSRAVMLALAAGAAAWVAVSPRLRARVGPRLLLGLPLAALALGLALHWGGAEALAGRVYLARIELTMLAQSLGAPAGLGSFAPDFALAQADHLSSHPDQLRWFTRLDHAHDDALELVYELGAPALAWLAAIGAALWRTRRHATRLQRAALVCLVEGAVLSMLGYPSFSPASAVVGALALAICFAPASAGTDRSVRTRVWIGRIGRVALLGLGLALLVIGARRYQAEHTFTRAMQAAWDGDLAGAQALTREANAAWPVD